MTKKSESFLEYAVMFMAMAALAVGIIRIWIWFNANYASRQIAYQKSRTSSGRPDEGSYPAPIDIDVKPLDLTEEWVFKGEPSGTITGAPVEDLEGGGFRGICDEECTNACGECQECQCYLKCDAQCTCRESTEGQVQAYRDQAESMRKAAHKLMNAADKMDDKAEDCDDPWETCWWGDWGKTPKELRKAARKCRIMAVCLGASASEINTRANLLEGCCNLSDQESIKNCIDGVDEQELIVKIDCPFHLGPCSVCTYYFPDGYYWWVGSCVLDDFKKIKNQCLAHYKKHYE